MPKSEVIVKRRVLSSGAIIKDIDDVRRHGLRLEDSIVETTHDDLSLPQIAQRLPFPVNALGRVLGDASIALADGVQVPSEIAGHSILTTAAFVAQDKRNVLIDGREIPLSLFVMTVAGSGDRKSACDKIASAPISEWQRQQVKIHTEALEDYRKAQDVYDVAYKQALAGKKSEVEKIHELDELSPPSPPLEPIAICQEPTLEGLQKSFRFGYPSQALFNDEGAQFFGGHAMSKENRGKTIAGLSKYWDGAPIARTRAAQGESALMFDRRLSIHILLQPVIAREILSDPLLMEQGWLARFLIAETQSLAGTRFYQPVNASEHPAVVRFHRIVTQQLSKLPETDEGGGLRLPNIELSPEAKAYWVEAYNHVERQLSVGELLEPIKPVAGKAAENALRIAGVFSVIEETQVISEEQIARAWQLATYYLQNALRSAQVSLADECERSAIEVLEWMKSQKTSVIQITDIQKKIIPAKHRKSVNAIRMTMDYLISKGGISLEATNSKGDPSAWKVLV